ncbi:MAG: threonine--tRNA ligase [Actinomycetota bacterium]|jgi:threonyl-tRNA synthetase|nr:MAG: threonine--tRNA ligase [Actinomycetota bacterium]
MPRVQLPDGPVELPDGEPVGSVLPPTSIAARVDGVLRDLAFVPTGEAIVEPVRPEDPDGLRILRHSSAHVLARACCDLFPGTRYAIGPPTDDGFYYDLELPTPVGVEDLARIEARMRELVAADEPFVREDVSRAEARERLAAQPYKVEILEKIGQEAGEVGAGETVSLYRNGDWVDLCEGPHVPSTGRLGAFRLTKLAGAYWRGDESRPMLTRIYGTAWASDDDLARHLERLAEAERRDHRKLGQQLDLFSFPEELGPGLAVWHPRGGIVRKELEDFVRELHLARGYELVVTPHLARRTLWDTSGHTAKYAETMFPEMVRDEAAYFVKPMNCPFHVLIYKSAVRSYRELPMRLSELGTVYRYERVGTLHGLLRARGLTQDDSHIICREDQLVEEILGVFDLTLEIHRTFGFVDPVVNLSTRPGQAIGDQAMWAKAIEALTAALDRSGLAYTVAEGEGAFYGPKVDFHFHDAIGRLWQLTTVQCDFALPERFDMTYTGEDNERHRPVMIHRAILGSLERFCGVLIEHYAGAFPLWLAPEQLRLVPVADRHVPACRELAQRARAAGLRAHVDETSASVGKKIRAAQLLRSPYVVVVGDRDLEAGTYTVRDREGTEWPGVDFDRLVDALVEEVASRRLEQTRFGG